MIRNIRAVVTASLIGVAALSPTWQNALAAKVTCGMDPRSAAVVRLEMSHWGKSQMLPHGCATIVGTRVCVPSVTVDGHRLSDIQVLANTVNQALIRNPRHPAMQSTEASQAGIAVAVFDELVQIAAHRAHIHASLAAARALARHELKLAESSPHPCGFMLPPGVTARQYFLSPRTIAAYREGMIVGQERERIIRQYQHPGVSVQRAFKRWLTIQLPTDTIRIDGHAPSFSIAAAYPAR